MKAKPKRQGRPPSYDWPPIKQITAWRKAGETWGQIASRIGCPEPTVIAHARIRGLCVPQKIRTEKRRHEAEARRHAEMIAEAAMQRAFDAADAAVARGVVSRRAAIHALRSTGLTLEMIGQHYHLTRERIRQICARSA